MEVSSPFGSRTRTRVLVALRLLEQSYPRELARFLGTPLSVVQKGIRSLEADDLVAGRSFGRTRIFQLNPRYFAATEVQTLLNRLIEANVDLRRRAAKLRRRPRRTAKPLPG